jgi:hypothetical protein
VREQLQHLFALVEQPAQRFGFALRLQADRALAVSSRECSSSRVSDSSAWWRPIA